MEFPCNMLSREIHVDLPPQPKIPRPANAFMLYANENRKKMARAFPLDSNKEISKRLGKGWKELDEEQKALYYTMAKKVDEEHKLKYPDYTYNPKEARIRKAMRDANRERAMGVAPSTRGGRRSQPWVLPESEEQFMMTPSHGMRGVVGSPICGTGFPIGNVGNGQFMQPMPTYNKHMHLISHESNGYLQANPMAQLQHQTDMWNQYHSPNPIRPNQDPFVLTPSQMPTYHHQPPSEMQHPVNSQIEKAKSEFPKNSVSPHTNENVPPNRNDIRLPMSDPVFEGKVEPLMESAQAEPFLNVYQDNVVVQNPFDKTEKMKKNFIPDWRPENPTAIPFNVFPSLENLPQSEPSEDAAAYHREYIRKYIETLNCDVLEIVFENNENRIGFSYVTYPSGHTNQFSSGNTIEDLYFIQSCCYGIFSNEDALNLCKSNN